MTPTHHTWNRRLLSGLLVFMLLLSMFAGSVVALENEDTGSMDSYTTEGYKPYRAWSTADARWASLKLGTSTDTMKTRGSAIVAITKLIIQAGIANESELTPAVLLDYLNNHNGFINGDELVWSAPNNFTYNTYGKTFKNVAGGSSALGTINQTVLSNLLTWMNQGYSIAIAVYDPASYSNYHWIALDSSRSLADNAVYIMDCHATGENANVLLANAYTTINAIQFYQTVDMPHVHSYQNMTIEPTCTETGSSGIACACGESKGTQTSIPALGHEYDNGVVTKAPGCTTSGVMTYTCIRCPDGWTEPIPALGHSFQNTVTAPTCTKQGYTHYACTACTYAYDGDYVPAKGHDYTVTIVDCTETVDGYTEYECNVCHYLYRDNIIPAHAHVFPATWTIDEPSTATNTGTQSRVCQHPQCDKCQYKVIPWRNPYTDVTPDTYYYIPVLWAAGRTPPITAGTSATTFSPDDACTRGQVVTFLWRAAGQPEPTITCPFTDVSPSDYYYKAVTWALEKGITLGTGPATFTPNKYVTRAEFVTFLWRYAGWKKPSAPAAFEDVKLTDYYYVPVGWAVENGITYGMDATHFNPTGYCRRAQVACFLYRYLGE